MPGQLTKHPEITPKVLRSASTQCGEGAPQDILTQCPADRFCKLPGGQLCVFGLPEASKMTQITALERQAIAPAAQAGAQPDQGSVGTEAFFAGAVIGIAYSRLRRGSH